MADTQKIEVPGIGIVEFPATMSDAQISSAIQSNMDMAKGRKIVSERGLGGTGASLAGALNVLQGPTFGFLDELAGAGAAAFGAPFSDKSMSDRYRSGRDVVRGMTGQYREEFPTTALITGAMGSAPTAMIGGGATALGAVPRMMQAARVGGIQGAASGAGESTASDIGGVAADIAKGGGTGAVFGGAGQGVVGGAGSAISNVAQRYSPQAAQNAASVKLAEALMRGAPEGSVFTLPGATSTPAARAAARIDRFGPEATIADVSGQAPKQLLDVLATLPGRTKDSVERLIRERQAGRAGRIMTAADDALGTRGAGYVASLDALEATQKAAQAPLRAQLEGISVRADDELIKLLNREPSAFAAAKNLATKDPDTYGLPIDLSKLKVGDDVPFSALDTVKKALWTIAEKEKVNFSATAESRATNGIRVALTDKLDRLSPKDNAGASIYRQAREAFAGPAELRSAIEAGRGVMKADAISVADITRGMSASEIEAFRIGALQSLRDKVGTEAGQTSLIKMWKEPATSDKLRAIFGNDYRRFATEVAKEGQLKALETTGRGSQSMQRAFAAGDLDNQALMEAAQAAKSGLSGNLAEAAKSAGRAWNKASMPEATRNELARLLMSRGQEAQANLRNVDELIRALNADAARRAALVGGVSGQMVTK